MSKKKNLAVDEVVNNEVVAADTVTEVVEPAVVTGFVTECAKLNIRKKPSLGSDVVCIVPINTKLIIDEKSSKGDWYKITTDDGKYGYCMKKYVNIVD